SATPATAIVSTESIRSAAGWTAARVGCDRLSGADEGADELVLYGWGDGVRVDAGGTEKFASIIYVVDARRFDVDGFKPCVCQFLLVFRIGKRPGDTADPELHALANFCRHFAANNHIGNGKPPSGL